MNNTDNALSFDAVIQNSQFNAQIQQMVQQLKGLSDTSVSQADKMDQAFSKLGRAAAGYFAFTELSQLPQKLIQVRGEFQQLEIAFSTMLGSKVKADQLFAQVVQLAATTPFDLASVANGAKQLLAYGVASQDITKTLTRLGDVAAGLSIPLNDLTYLYGTTKTQGRLFAQDLNQFVGRGIPLIRMLAEQFGVAESEVKGLVEQGKVGFPEVEKAINKLTDSGGMFAGLMSKQAESLTGLYSNFEDTVAQAFNNIGKSQEGVLAGSIKLATLTVENYEPILDILTVIIATYGAYKAAVIATAAVQAVAATGPAVSAWLSLAGSIRSASDAQALFNLTTKANPYVIAATALVALVTAVALFRDTTSEADKAMLRVANSAEEVEKSMSSELATIQSLTTQIKNQNSANGDREKALKQLIALNPELLSGLNLENVATQEGAKAIDTYIEAKKKQIELKTIEKELDESMQREIDAKNNKNEVGFGTQLLLSAGSGLSTGQTSGSVDYINQVKQANKDYNEEIQKTEKTLQTSLLERIKLIGEAGAADNKNADSVSKNKAKTIAAIEDEIKSLKDSQKATSTTRAEYDKYQKQIDILEKKQRAITGELTSAQKKAAKDADKVGPYGSLSYWDDIARKAQEIIDKTPAFESNASKITEQYRIKFEAENKAEAIRKDNAIKSFDDELSEKRNQFALYQRWVEAYGKEAADKQFETLVSGNESYLDYLNTQIRKLESTANYTKLNKQDTSNLDSLISEKNRVTSKDTGIEVFNKKLEDAQKNSGSLIETLEKLNAIQNELGTPKTDEDFTSLQKVAELRAEVKKEMKNVLDDFIIQANANGARVLAIEKKHIELKQIAQKEYSGKELKIRLQAIEESRKAEIDAINDEEFQKSDSFKRINKEYLDYGRRQIKQRIDDIKEALEKEKLSIKAREELELKLARTKRELNQSTADGLRDAANLINQVLGDTNLKISKSFSVSIKEIGTALNNVANLMDDSASTSSQVGSIIGIISFAITTARDAMLTAKDVATEMDGQVESYKNIQNELAGINILLERQKTLLDDLQGVDRASNALALYDKYAQQQQDALKNLQALSVDVIKSQKEVFIDPVFGTEVENKGIKGVWTQLMTGGQAKTKIKYQFESVDTSGFDDIEDYIKLLAEIKSGGGKLYGKEVVQADIDSLELLISTYNEAVEQQKALMDELKAYYTGTSQEAIVDSIVQGFIDGKSSAEDFANDFEAMMIKAVTNSLKAELLDKDMQQFYDKFSEYSLSDFTLTDVEIAELKAMYNKIIEEGQKKYDEIEKITGVDISADSSKTNKSLTGSIQGVTEETASILAGQINAIRISQADGLNISRSSLFELTAIKVNTGLSADELRIIRGDISEMRRLMSTDFMRAIGG